MFSLEPALYYIYIRSGTKHYESLPIRIIVLETIHWENDLWTENASRGFIIISKTIDWDLECFTLWIHGSSHFAWRQLTRHSEVLNTLNFQWIILETFDWRLRGLSKLASHDPNLWNSSRLSQRQLTGDWEVCWKLSISRQMSLRPSTGV